MKQKLFSLALLASTFSFAQLLTPQGQIQATTNPETGNVGIGTATPQAKFDVNFGNEQKTIKFFQPFTYANPADSLVSSIMFTWYNNHTDIGLIRGGSDNIIGLGFRFNGDEKVRFTPVGNASFLGKVEAKEIKVTLTPTADFVFEKDYQLPDLGDIEKYIKRNKHLPEIASAEIMKKEGVNIGEFQIKLLQKIEELTLYSIEQNKQIQELKTQVQSLISNQK